MTAVWTEATRQTFWRRFPDSRTPMLVSGDEGVYRAANDAACRLLGRSPQDIVGQEVGFLAAPDERRRLPALVAEFRQTGYLFFLGQIVRPDGEPVEIEGTAARDAPEARHHLTLLWPREDRATECLLSRREHEITALLASGLTGAQIAEQLGLSPDTVRTHVRNAMERSGAATRAHLVALAVGSGMVPRPKRT